MDLADRLLFPVVWGVFGLTWFCLIAGIVVRGRLPLPLIVAGPVGPLAAFAYGVLDTRSRVHAPDLDFWLRASAVWTLAVAASLVQAVCWIGEDARSVGRFRWLPSRWPSSLSRSSWGSCFWSTSAAAWSRCRRGTRRDDGERLTRRWSSLAEAKCKTAA